MSNENKVRDMSANSNLDCRKANNCMTPYCSCDLLHTRAPQAASGELYILEIKGAHREGRAKYSRPNHAGYTNLLSDAGRFSKEEAMKHAESLPDKYEAKPLPSINSPQAASEDNRELLVQIREWMAHCRSLTPHGFEHDKGNLIDKITRALEAKGFRHLEGCPVLVFTEDE
jgi:hypothetical protein